MKKVLAVLVTVALMAGCFVGCAGGALQEKDFLIYKDGKEVKNPDENESGLIYLEEGEQTVRGIKLGDSVEAVEQAYKGVGVDVSYIEEQMVMQMSDGRGYRLTFQFSGEGALGIFASRTKEAADAYDKEYGTD